MEEGTKESNIVEKSLAGFVGFPGEGERGGSGEEFLLPGEPYVTVTFGVRNGDPLRSLPTSSSVLAGDGVRIKGSTDTLRRLWTALSRTGSDSWPACFRFVPERLPYIRGFEADIQVVNVRGEVVMFSHVTVAPLN